MPMTVLYTHAENKQLAADRLNEAMVHVSDWLRSSCLHLNTNKTVCMFFSRNSTLPDPDIVVNGNSIQVVSEFKYLGITLDSHLTFKKHVKKVTNTIKFNLANFRHIRPYLTTDAAKLFMHAMIFFSHNILLHNLVSVKRNNSKTHRITIQTDTENTGSKT